ncbi:MAG: Rieske (2Fe-2S) protein [Gammaproteobacteria bacterium]|nr:MAG: Rieske (2Fe-2S) protein [Gammaproteobacteria bacterium]RKZ93600.1 MAG: Rieske (2Fe-2S) protein [Gammaproteobacteria bacterium]
MSLCLSRHFLCFKQDIPNYQARGFNIEINQDKIELLLVRQNARVQAYKNHCPHLGIPLNWQPDEFMSLEGSHIQCSTHGALFSLEDGHCIAGPCTGQNLTTLALERRDDNELWLQF